MATVPGQTTIGSVRMTAQLESAMERSTVVKTPEWNQYIQTAFLWLYGILVQKFGQNYAQKILVFNTTNNTSLYDLPPDTFKVSKIDTQLLAAPSGFWTAAERVELSVIQRYDLPDGYAGWINKVWYALMGEYGTNQKLWLAPVQSAGRPVRLIYVPRMATPTDQGTIRLNRVVATDTFTFTATNFGALTLTAGTDFAVGTNDLATAINLANAFIAAAPASLNDGFTASVSGKVVTISMQDACAAEIAPVAWSQTGGHMTLTPPTGWTNLIDGVNGWEEYLAVDSAMKALQKQYRDASHFETRRMGILRNIEDEAGNRDAGAPVTGADTLGLDSGSQWDLTNGGPGSTMGGGY